MNAYVAVDIGASSGRLVAGHLADGKIILTELHRFKNGAEMKNGHLVWDADGLFRGIVEGLKTCGEAGMKPVSLGVDTWGVDYALLDQHGARIGDTIAYRDDRTLPMPDRLDDAALYAVTGIQRHNFNTIYQLMADDRLKHAADMLLMPEYLHYLLTGARAREYTNATTTALVNAKTRDWDIPLIDSLALPRRLFGALKQPGAAVGALKKEIAAACGFQTNVVLPPTHDTAAAVLGAPLGDSDIFLSSGTWSLIGAEMREPILTEDARCAGMTNEGGVNGTYRFLKNITGMWMLERLRAELPGNLTYGEVTALARAHLDCPARVDVNAPEFLAPERMRRAILEHLKQTGQQAPESAGALLACVHLSLAESYAQTVRDIEKLCGKTFASVAVVGGGSRNALLNELTARACLKPVLAGPVEGTALGNLLSQMLASGEIASVGAARRVVADSFERAVYHGDIE